MFDYFKILNAQISDSPDKLKIKYKKLASIYHPDVNPKGAEKMKKINEAYGVLKDKKKRTEYLHKFDKLKKPSYYFFDGAGNKICYYITNPAKTGSGSSKDPLREGDYTTEVYITDDNTTHKIIY